MATATLDSAPFTGIPQPRRWTREEFYRLADLGMFDGQRVERIGGEIIVMSPQRHPHAAAVTLGTTALYKAFGSGYTVRPQLPLCLGLDDDPESDLIVIAGSQRDYQDHPTSAVLVVEVSDTTLTYDRKRKGPLYARAAIQDYWIVNLIDRQVEVYREPTPNGYARHDVFLSGGMVQALLVPAAQVAVSDLLP